ncbi:hypothetical protein D3C75_744350 [compost metagenome]
MRLEKIPNGILQGDGVLLRDLCLVMDRRKVGICPSEVSPLDHSRHVKSRFEIIPSVKGFLAVQIDQLLLGFLNGLAGFSQVRDEGTASGVGGREVRHCAELGYKQIPHLTGFVNVLGL